MRACLTLIAIFMLAPQLCFGEPQDLDKYVVVEGGLVDIKPGSHIEGSVKNGGLQPDYILDFESPSLRPLMKFARKTRALDLPYWTKVDRVLKYISGEVLPHHDYNDPRYLGVLDAHRFAKTAVPISRYAACHAGVCREHALLTHFALKEAGIPNLHAYATIRRASSTDAYDVIEDHAFVVVEHENKKWVVDAYYWGFNGFLFDELRRPEGVTENSLAAPIATPATGFRRIIKINAYPTIWVPKVPPPPRPQASCSDLLLNLWRKVRVTLSGK